MARTIDDVIDEIIRATYIDGYDAYFPADMERMTRFHVDLAARTADMQMLNFDYYGNEEDPEDMTTWGTDPDGYDFWWTICGKLTPEEQNKVIRIAEALLDEA